MAIGKPLTCGTCPLSERAQRGPKGRLQLHCDLSGQARAPGDHCNAPRRTLLEAAEQIVRILAQRDAPPK